MSSIIVNSTHIIDSINNSTFQIDFERSILLQEKHMWRDQVKYQHSSTSAVIPKTGQNTRIQRGEQWDLFFFASRFDAVELRSSPRLLATAQNTNCQVRLRGLWAMADALCAES